MTIGYVSTIREAWGGSEELWAASAEAALDAGNKVIICAYDTGGISVKTERLIEKGAILTTRIGNIDAKVSRFEYLRKRLSRIYDKCIGNPYHGLFQFRPDIVLYIGSGYSIADDYKLIQLIKKYKTKFFINVQLNEEECNALLPKRKRKVEEAYGLAKKVLFVSARNQEKAEVLLKKSIPNALVVRNPVNMQDKTVVAFPQEEVPQLAMVGNLITVHKGQDIVLNILQQPAWQQRQWQLNIYGAGPDEASLKAFCEKNKLAGRVVFHGKVNDIRAVWQKNHLLLMPSRMEGMPLAVVEAMLCGRPSVVTDVGGMVEWVEDSISGFVAPEASLEAVGGAMEKAWQCRNDWQNIGLAAHKRALELYDPNPGQTLLRLITEN